MKQLLITIVAMVLVGCGPSISIHEASKTGDIDALITHLKNGTDPNLLDAEENEFTPLFGAENTDVVRILLNHGADPNYQTSFGHTPLQSHMYYPSRVKLLIEYGADVNIVQKGNSSVLHHYVIEGDIELVQFIIDNGANINVKDNNGMTPLDLASDGLAQLLKKHGGETSEVLERKMMADDEFNDNRPENELNTIFFESIIDENIEELKQCLENGVDINSISEAGNAAIHEAVFTGNTNIINLLLFNGFDVNVKGSGGMTPLHHSADLGQKEIAILLLKNGAKINTYDDLKRTPLDLSDNIELSNILINKGGYFSNIFFVARSGNVEILKGFLKKHNKINIDEKYGSFNSLNVASLKLSSLSSLIH